MFRRGFSSRKGRLATVTLDKRLRAVAALVRPGSRVADIGTDHAYLPVSLVQSGVCPSAIASDVRSGPLAAAESHVMAAGLFAQISLRLGDGLMTVMPQEVDDIVIAGMGGETVAAILEAAPWVRDTRLRLILQPMTRAEDTRRWLLTNGFTLDEEHLVTDGRHLYPVMAASYTAAPPQEDAFWWYAGALSPEEGAPYFAMMQEHLLRRAAGFAHSGDAVEVARLTDIAERLRHYVRVRK